jgi:ribonuclease HII
MLLLNYNIQPNDESNEIQVGIDEAGKGSMIGPVFAAAVIWNNDVYPQDIKDSKLLSRKKRPIVKQFIEENALAYGVGYATHTEVDDLNINNATFLAMHRALKKINIHFDRILVDGNIFKPYYCNVHTCIVGGDNKYVNIAAASILAKEYHDEWINEKFKEDTIYDLINNKGYGTKNHINAIRKYGILDEHRITYCKKYI